jgi:hypothetical protein
MSCDHKDCRCEETYVEAAGKHFCSEPCADSDASGEPVHSCGCGHPDCAAV